MTVENDGTVIIMAPKYTRKARIEQFYKANLAWIEKRRKELSSLQMVQLTDKDIAILKKKAKEIMTAKTLHYANIMGVTPRSVKITSAKKRWGSCRRTGKNYDICYSYRTMFLSDKAQDYIVVHELAHILHFNHSKAFYAQIEEVLPDWRVYNREADTFKDNHIY